MNTQETVARPIGATGIKENTLIKANPALPALVATSRGTIAIRAGTSFAGVTFGEETAVPLPALVPGTDYVVIVPAAGGPVAALTTLPIAGDVLGGFHFAPGGNASVRAGGDDVPAINPFSIWDVLFRPACPDPRGMALVGASAGGDDGDRQDRESIQPFWCDIYLTGTNHLADGTSRLGAPIADGNDPADRPGGGRFNRFDYAAASAVMTHHGKGLLAVDEFFAAAYGVTEKTACDKEPEMTGLDAPRTSRWGVMQASGNMWVWGHDGDPDLPRASVFGGAWWDGGSAGSRYAFVGYWPGNSGGGGGARGRCDHLQLV